MLFVFAIAVGFKLFSIQVFEGSKYRDLAEKRTVKNVTIPANRGNVYSANGNLLATSVPKYEIRFDAVTPSHKNFERYIAPMCDALSKFHKGKRSSRDYQKKLRQARANKNRYVLLGKNLSYSEYQQFKTFPLLKLGAFKGGLIVEQKTKREYPMGAIAQRTIGYERQDEYGNVTRPGIDGAFGEKYLRGKDGRRLKQKIGKGQWKPIVDYNHIEPQDGYDVYTTLNVNIQDIAHHALLKQLEYYEADHGCVVVMDVASGEIKAISNLGRTKKGGYYERLNYAVGESHEPGSTFKLMALMVALEDNVVDTTDIINTGNGVKEFYGRKIYDSRYGGYGKISVARAFEVSSNIAMASIITNNYAKKPHQFLDRLASWRLNSKTGVSIIGEGKPVIPKPGDNLWSRNALPSIAYGYNLRLTPLQVLTFYNAVANNGTMVKPRFIRKVKDLNEDIKTFDRQVTIPKIASESTIRKVQRMLKNVVVKGTGKSLHAGDFSMAGKTGTARTEYWKKDWNTNRRYISSFAGYFPAENPQYSCIVVIHKPKVKKGFYGADVSGPVFKRIAQKIFTDTPLIDAVEALNVSFADVDSEFHQYHKTARKFKTIMPSVLGLPVMDAIPLLENMGLKVRYQGDGKVVEQSITKGEKVTKHQTVYLTVS